MIAKSFLHLSAIFSICSNITCVSLSTITTIWGSSKALRGKDGSMDEAVEGINDERKLIFQAFACGLGGNLCTVLSACFITMDYPINIMASCGVLFTAWLIYNNAVRIQKKFFFSQAVRLDDLTNFPTPELTKLIEEELSNPNNNSSSGKTTGRSRKGFLDSV